MTAFRRLLLFVLPLWRWVIASAGLGTLTIAASIGLLTTSAYLISAAALHPSIAELQVAVVGVRFFGLSRGFFRYLERLVSHNTTFRLLARIRSWFYGAIEPLAPDQLNSLRAGDLLTRAIADIDTLKDYYVRVLAPPLVALLIIISVSLFMGAFDQQLALILLVFLLLYGIGLSTLMLVLGISPGRSLIESRARLQAELVDGIQGLPDLLAFGQVENQLKCVHDAERNLYFAQRKFANISGLQSGLSILLSGMGIWFVLVLGVILVTEGQIQGVYLAVIVLAASASFEAVQGLPQAGQHMESNQSAAERLFAIADSTPAVTDPHTSLPVPERISIELHDLQYAYDARAGFALQGVTLAMPPGKKIAVVGPSGAGKTTLANLLLRFLDCKEGGILLNGMDVHSYDQEDVRRVFSVVSQHTFLFNTSLRENLLLARPEATQEEIEHACQQAALHDFVQSLPQGYETCIGEHGQGLSGGERQRLAIARALLKNAPFFILDEPTANLDPGTEEAVVYTLQQVIERRSTLWITHRLIGLDGMDEIIVLEKGNIIQRGTHTALMMVDGLYRQMWKIQNMGMIETGVLD